MRQIVPQSQGASIYLHDELQTVQQLHSVAMVPIGPRWVVSNHNLPGRLGGLQLPVQAPQLRPPVLALQAPCKQLSQLSGSIGSTAARRGIHQGKCLLTNDQSSRLARYWADG